MFGLDGSKAYRPSDDALRLIASEGLLAKWRSEGKGPPFVKVEGKVFYDGADLIRWLTERRVSPSDGAPVAA